MATPEKHPRVPSSLLLERVKATGLPVEKREGDFGCCTTKEEEEDWAAQNRAAEQLAKSVRGAAVPSLSHLSLRDYQCVYEPSDDTFLFLDAIQYELSQIDITERRRRNRRPFICLEMGCGTGVLSAFFRSTWYNNQSTKEEEEETPLISFCTDINPLALQVTQRTLQQPPPSMGAIVELLHCDLATPLLPRLQGQVDVILFNPPYVPTPPEEVMSAAAMPVRRANAMPAKTDIDWLPAAWAGGTHGRQVLDRALPQIAALLRKNDDANDRAAAAAYIVTVDENQPRQCAEALRQTHGLRMRPLLRRRARNEFLTIQKITWR